MENSYRTIEVKLGKYIRKFEMRDNYIGSFVINNTLFNVIGTGHSFEKLEERNLSKYHVLASIVGLGDKLSTYNNSGQHIIISDENKKISTIFTVENYTIVVITVIDKGAIFISRNGNKPTVYESFENVG